MKIHAILPAQLTILYSEKGGFAGFRTMRNVFVHVSTDLDFCISRMLKRTVCLFSRFVLTDKYGFERAHAFRQNVSGLQTGIDVKFRREHTLSDKMYLDFRQE